MAKTRNRTQIMLDDELYRKLHNICFAQKNALGIKNASVSKIINTAVTEYINNHYEELNSLFDTYRREGGHIEL